MKHVSSDGAPDSLENIQKEFLTAIALGHSLDRITIALCKRVEALAPDCICSILQVDEHRRLKTLAAPSLPLDYVEAVDGIEIGPTVGSCGTAAYFGCPIEVTDIASDPLWAAYKELALSLGLRACWSSPISANGRVVGTFAFYFSQPRGASALERTIVSACVDLCAIAIEQSESRAKIQRLAYFDQLTGLGNRAMLKERGDEVLGVALSEGCNVALCYLDLDGFKAVNDLHGHNCGDQVLAKVGAKLRLLAPNADLVVRLGGDEFVVVQRIDSTPGAVYELAQRLSEGICHRYEIDDGADAVIGVSIGVACFPNDGDNIERLIAHADTALYEVKKRRSGGYMLFDSRMETEQFERRALERDVCLAKDLKQLSLVYQPILSVEAGRPVGFEALLRWHHPLRGSVPTDNFIAAAESSGAIERIGSFALKEACREAATWQNPLRISVNVSPAQIVLGDFAELVESVLADSGLKPQRLEIEVTESLFIRDSDSALRTLNRLRDLGVSIAIDDFGTGFSSLSTLRSFPFDRIKIDRRFVSGMTTAPEDGAIVKAVLALGHAMNLSVVAEGVETEAQRSLLELLGCNYLQGFLFGRPLPIRHYADMLSASALKVA